MPAGDRTGPWGFGSMTGRAAGYCAGYPVPGYMNPMPRIGWGFGFGRGWGRGRGRGFGFGRGWGRGFGRGFGRRWWFYPPIYPYAQTPYFYRPPIPYNYPTPYGYPQMYPPITPYAPYLGPAQYAPYPGHW